MLDATHTATLDAPPSDDVVRSISEYRFVWKDKIFTIGVSVGLVEISRESGSLDFLALRRVIVPALDGLTPWVNRDKSYER